MAQSVADAVQLLVADECWVSLALLLRSNPQRKSFSAREILDRLKHEGAFPEVRAGVQAHIYQHNVANVEPSSARYRMFYKLEDGTFRLFRPGDTSHPARTGKTAPRRSDLPERYHSLLDWYEREYCQPGEGVPIEEDPVLQMRGVGKDLWASLGGGDAFIAREREGWDESDERRNTAAAESLSHRAWKRIVAHENKPFQTVTGLSLAYEIEGDSAIWFYRDGKRVNQRLARGEVNEALKRCPLENTAAIKDLRDYPYLFAVLMDPRIRGNDW